jgi:hypothetical protein
MEKTTYKKPINFYLPSLFVAVIEYKWLNWIMLNKDTTLEIYVFMKNVLQWMFKQYRMN